MAKGSKKKEVPYTLEGPEGKIEGQLVVTDEILQALQEEGPKSKRLATDLLQKAIAKDERKAKKAIHDLVDMQIDLIANQTAKAFNKKIGSEVRAFLLRKTQHLRGPALFEKLDE